MVEVNDRPYERLIGPGPGPILVKNNVGNWSP